MSQTCGCGCKHGAVAAAGASGPAFAPEETVDTAVRRSPRALPVLRELGIDTCCGGSLTLAQAAASAGIPTERVLERLWRALREPAET
jgi:iron-sulfur cluster repair protein YtfE (RIC family)